MHTIICQNDIGTIVQKMQEYLMSGRTINGIHLVDHSDQEIVLLVADKIITEEMAEMWWLGYRAALA